MLLTLKSCAFSAKNYQVRRPNIVFGAFAFRTSVAAARGAGRTIYLILLILFVSTACLFAGDIANFQNLGFSPDSRYFMFGQYGIIEKTSSPYADIFFVNVKSNTFLPQGVKHVQFREQVKPGNDGRGALFSLLEESYNLTKKYNISHIATGRFLYILMDGEEPKEELNFRDFQSGQKYNITLSQKSRGEGKNIEAAFHIVLKIEDKSGKIRNLAVGLPNYWRSGVSGYRIKRIILAPDEKSLVFMIQMEEVDSAGPNIRFMVETVVTGS
jgi:predicted secreted protein